MKTKQLLNQQRIFKLGNLFPESVLQLQNRRFQLLVFILLLTVTANAALVTLTYKGTVSSIQDDNNVIGSAFKEGDSFTATISYDPDAPHIVSSTQLQNASGNIVKYQNIAANTGFSLTVNSTVLKSTLKKDYVTVYNSPSDWSADYLVFENEDIDNPLNTNGDWKLVAGLNGENGNFNIFTSGSLPKTLDLSLFQPGALELVDSQGFLDITFDPTSVTTGDKTTALSTAHSEGIDTQFYIKNNALCKADNTPVTDLAMYDVSGKLVLSNQYVNANSIDVSALTKGAYILRYKNTNGQLMSEKIIR
jgi:hypothetical protein